MRKSTKNIEQYRLTTGPMASNISYGFNGFFIIQRNGHILRAQCSDETMWEESRMAGKPWQHVSVSLENRCPTWDEMEFIRDLFWHESETVMQLSVPRKEHVNMHPYCLHLWKPLGVAIPVPPSALVGVV